MTGEGPALYLPGRYAKEVQDQERPLDYAGRDESGHLVIVANAKEWTDRIPLDELQDMLQERLKKRKAKGLEQRAADVNKAMQEFWGERREWIRSRQRNATRMGWTPGMR